MGGNRIVVLIIIIAVVGSVLIGAIGQSRTSVIPTNTGQKNQSPEINPNFSEPAMWKFPFWPTGNPQELARLSTPFPTVFPTLTSLPAVIPTVIITAIPTIRPTSPAVLPTGSAGNFIYRNLSNPARVEVFDKNNVWLATFTNGSYTVVLSGPERSFSESSSPFAVRHNKWVRLLPGPFGGSVDEAWLTRALVNRSPDIIDQQFQYLSGAPVIKNSSGLQIAGDASYGPLVSGSRQEGSDFNDYLGLNWTYPDGTSDPAEANQIRSLDCSGFQRMVFGYRNNLPMSIDPKAGTIPRRSFQIYESGLGNITIAISGSQITNFNPLQVGDLVFFDGSTNNGTRIDHVGMYIGVDQGGHYRFVSSRKGADGPTIGDINGASVLDGSGLYARSFRGARRI